MTTYNLIESGIRGGMTFVNKHHVVADDNTELLYVDIQNLYGCHKSCHVVILNGRLKSLTCVIYYKSVNIASLKEKTLILLRLI